MFVVELEVDPVLSIVSPRAVLDALDALAPVVTETLVETNVIVDPMKIEEIPIMASVPKAAKPKKATVQSIPKILAPSRFDLQVVLVELQEVAAFA